MIASCLYIAETSVMGKGVFTSAPITQGSVIEMAPVIVMSAEERKWLDKTRLYDYIFEWGKDCQQCAMALGWVPIYNHSFESNCEYEMDYDADLIRIKTVRGIEAGEELFINYGGDWNSNRPLWFEAL